MNGFQIAGLSLTGVMVSLLLAGMLRGHLRKRVALFWIAVWGGGAILLIRPDYTRVMAQSLGIGRGTDLLLYCTVLASTAAFLWVYLRFRRLERQMTLLVRELAIERPRRPETLAGDASPPNRP